MEKERASKSQKELILKYSEEVISKSGLESVKISTIAKQLGLPTSLIHYYFKNKEGLLFAILHARLQEVLSSLEVHLQGITDPISRLRKMIWFQLYFNDTHRNYTRLLIFECRSKTAFYSHPAYSLIRKFANTLLAILEEGVEKKIFRGDVDMRLVRDIIFGTVDWENISNLVALETEDTVQDLDDILSIILPMITIQSRSSEIHPDKSVRIFKAAEKLFAEKGYDRTSMADISRLAQVAEGTIYEYYKNKHDLLLSIAKQRFFNLRNSLNEILGVGTPLRKLGLLIWYHYTAYLTQPDFLKIFLTNIQYNPQFYSSEAYRDLLNYIQPVTDTLLEGKKNRSIRPNVNPRVFKNIFLGSFCHVALRWLMPVKKSSMGRMDEINEIVSLLTMGIEQREL